MSSSTTIPIEHSQGAVAAFVTKVFGWMSLALAITGLTALFVASSPSLMAAIFSNSLVFWGLLIGQVLMVVYLSAAINRMSAATATFVFMAYSLVMGLTLSVIFVAYTGASVASTFFVTAGTFGAMTAYGYLTKTDLTRIGNLAFMALIGVILASLVNFFLNNDTLYWIITYVGVLIFVGLTAYDTQKIKQMGYANMDAETERKGAIMGALTMYLDFINLFLFLLRILGRRR